MKIPLATGETIDTDKLNDKKAELHEAMNNFYLVCKKYNVIGFAKMIYEQEEGLGMLYLPNENQEMRSKEYTTLVAGIADWIYKTSGKLSIVELPLEDGENSEHSS